MKANRSAVKITTGSSKTSEPSNNDHEHDQQTTEELLAPATTASKSRLKGILRVTKSLQKPLPASHRYVSPVSSSTSLNKRASGSHISKNQGSSDSRGSNKKKHVSFLTERALCLVAKNNCFVLKLGFAQHMLYNCRSMVLVSVSFSYASSLSLKRGLISCGIKKFNQWEGFTDFYQAYPKDVPYKRSQLNLRSFMFAFKDVDTDKTVLKFKRSSPFNLFGKLTDDELHVTTPYGRIKHLGIVRVPLDSFGDFYEIEDEDGYIEFEIPSRIQTSEDEFFYEVRKYQDKSESSINRTRKNYKRSRSHKDNLENIVGVVPVPHEHEIPHIIVSSSSNSIGEGEKLESGHLLETPVIRKTEPNVVYPGLPDSAEEADAELEIIKTPEHMLKKHLISIPEGSEDWVARIFMEKRYEYFVTGSKSVPKLRAGEFMVLFNDELLNPSPNNRILSEEQKARILGAAFFIRVRELSSVVPYPIIPS